jgi:undecaprenyl-diphosphatase
VEFSVSFVQLLVLSVVQGITEFLPISSSGHLILVPLLTGWPDQGLIIDVATHVGTLVAVLVYFWRDVWRMLVGVVRLAQGRRDQGALLAGYILIGTIPALAVGYVMDRYVGDGLRSMAVVAWAMVGFAVVLYVADRTGLKVRRIEHIGLGHAFIIGLAQAVAFIPGTSRSGITMVAARLLGYERADAARFSFLLSIPAICAAGLWEGLKLFNAGETGLLGDAVTVCVMSAIAGIIAIAGLMAWLRRATFTPFVVYRLVFGAFLLSIVYLGVKVG